MGLYKVDFYDRNGRMRHLVEGWFLYAAFIRPSTDESLVKIGISTKPFERLFSIHSGAPFPVEVALWTEVGSTSVTRRLEAEVKRALADRNTRGEWFRFDLTSVADKRAFHDTLNEAYLRHTGKVLQWQKTSGEQIRAYAGVLTSKRRKGVAGDW